jgi:hypothetical protein
LVERNDHPAISHQPSQHRARRVAIVGLFTKNTLTIDETVDVVTFIVAGSMYSYATYGSTLSATLRKEMCDQRVELRGKQASMMHKAKLSANAEQVTRVFISDPVLSQQVVDAYGAGASDATKRAFLENVVAPYIRKYLFQAGVL